MKRKLEFPVKDENFTTIISNVGRFKKQHSITIVTPMFGGGTEAGAVDEANPIRSSSVRGNLRFWWRATRGASFESTAELLNREIEIFGDTSNPSPIKIWVEASEDASKFHDAKVPRINPKNNQTNYVLNSSLNRYALFPFDDNKPKTRYCNDLKFNLFIEMPSGMEQLYEKELKPALWAWINFGGVGARTRRGCGSLHCDDFSPGAKTYEKLFPLESVTKVDLLRWYKKSIEIYELKLPTVDAASSTEWPVLCDSIKINRAQITVTSAWNEAVEVYRKFRRTPNPPMNRNMSEAHPKRSFWPEADSIRKLTNMSDPDHVNSQTIQDSKGVFPRAQLGLPIQFQFANRRKQTFNPKDPNKGIDPYKTTLLPKVKDKVKERLASPLILKGLAISVQSGKEFLIKGCSIIAILKQPEIEKLTLTLIKDNKIRGNELSWWKQVSDELEKVTIYKDEIYPTLNYFEKFENRNPMRIGVSSNWKDGVGNIPKTQSAILAFLHSKEVAQWE
ncbi:type III-B CRISPR module RAMP protein Cmr1 [Paenibacillus sp. GSMTC-2017]|uniref:type III-B CRISPR module RAMP protein Cmr1 n=1 Tax=Paenibacillus sp. GSMTC-2017 TaxID=2794350 RepID=UPI001A27AD37|nr:type III-B CRISPR module RAMP protein Cmr1 [Paenibacillus sp. GSMTC-2017]MBH5320418.1 type III-B CRISPR module RAMP protein Cmr1 [Paenibacillus sp. GSMTC-2017]